MIIHNISGSWDKRKEWSYAIKKRDGFQCVHCGLKPQKARFLQAHHIKPKKLFPQLKWDLDNGITLCHWCHKKYHDRTPHKRRDVTGLISTRWRNAGII